MAVLEAFVYDPLINWRLMQPDVERREGMCALWFVHRFSPIGDPPSLLLVNLHFGFSSGSFPNCWVLTCAPHILGDSDRAADLVRAAAYPTAPIRKLKADENDILNGTSRDLRAIAFEGLTNYSIQRRRKSGTNAPCLCTDGYKISSLVHHPKYGHPSFHSLYRRVVCCRTRFQPGRVAFSVCSGRQAYPAGDVVGELMSMLLWMVRSGGQVLPNLPGLTLVVGARSGECRSCYITIVCFRCTSCIPYGLSLSSLCA